MHKQILALVGILTLALLGAGGASGALINGDFSSGLNGWTAGGATQVSAGAALEQDGANGVGSTLYQIAAYAPGTYTFSFELNLGLSSDVPQGTFPDSFFASLYFVDDPLDFDLSSGLTAQSVLGIDYAGPATLNGSLSAGSNGLGWTKVSYTFTHSYAYIVPFFELIDLNFTDNDSHVSIDNVTFETVQAVVPEPATCALMGLGLAALKFRRGRGGRTRRLQSA